jgi:hypothetical protein
MGHFGLYVHFYPVISTFCIVPHLVWYKCLSNIGQMAKNICAANLSLHSNLQQISIICKIKTDMVHDDAVENFTMADNL